MPSTEIQVKDVSCKEDGIWERDPEIPPSFLDKAHLKWTKAKWKTVLWTYTFKFEMSFYKEKKSNHLSSYQHLAQNPVSEVVLVSIELRAGLCGKAQSKLKAIYALIQITCFSGQVFHIWARQWYIVVYSTVYLLEKHGFVVEESGCWTDIPPVQAFKQMRTLGASLNESNSRSGLHGSD